MERRVNANLYGVDCPECGKKFKSIGQLDLHLKTHGMNKSAPSSRKRPHAAIAGEASADGATEDNGGNTPTFRVFADKIPAICPLCKEQSSTMTVLTKHYMRKHVQNVFFECRKCGAKKPTRTDITKHEALCLRGPDEGKVIRCTACQMLLPTANSWRTHSELSKHRFFDLCWPDGSSGDSAPPNPAESDKIVLDDAFGTVLDDDEAAALEAAHDARAEEEVVLVHVGKLDVLAAEGRPLQAREAAALCGCLLYTSPSPRDS